jgi:hypothetical protein
LIDSVYSPKAPQAKQDRRCLCVRAARMHADAERNIYMGQGGPNAALIDVFRKN